MDAEHQKHIELHSRIFMENPNQTRLFGYWEFGRYYQRFYRWLKTGVWPKKRWISGLIEAKKHVEKHWRWLE